ncbi:hypothetical protein GOV12_07445 [Candidatus Pacearchaeota archaeon]|nr:hypothetical protein [Candidatus Pacearchaeota archaeon]
MEDKKQIKKFIITKKIAKHGSQAIIVIPRALESRIRPGSLAEISIDIIDEVESEEVRK